MPALKLSEIRTRVWDEVRDSTLSLMTADKLDAHLNDGLRELHEVAGSRPHAGWTAPTVADQEAYTLPSDLYNVEALRVDGVKYKPTNYERYLRGDLGGNYYCVIGDTLYLTTAPKESGLGIELFGEALPIEMTGDDDTTGLGMKYDRALVYYGAYCYYRIKNTPDSMQLANYYRNLFEQDKRQLEQDTILKQGSGWYEPIQDVM